MLKVLLVYYEPQPSGQTTHVLSLSYGLDRNKYAITVVLPTKLNQSIAALKKAGVDVVPLRMSKILWNTQSIVSLIRLIRRQNFDIVHVHSQEAGLLPRIIARIAGAQTILYTPQCTNIQRIRWFWLYRSIEKILSHITDVIISVNEIDRMRIINWGIPSSKVLTIPNGIDLSLFNKPINSARVRRTLGLDEERPLVMQVGRLTNQKNPLAFVKGAAIVAREHPDVQFALVGDGPLNDEVETYIQELGMNNHVRWLGWQDKAYNFIGAADIISLTSRWEGLPYVLLEAMAWSRPVVTTEVNGCPEIVKHGLTGYIVPQNDVVAWANCVIKLLDDPLQSVDMGQRGNELVIEEFSLQKMIDQIQRLYDRLILN